MKLQGEIDFVHTGPGTLAGRYLRQFWQPIFVSQELKKGRPYPVKIMSEDFTVYRGESGKPYVVASRCPHRLTSLTAGWIEGETIRCSFHGWSFDPSGKCLEQPAEPVPFCNKISLATYPTKEHLGFIFAYLGADAPPPFPKWPELEHETEMSSSLVIPCNYFQSAENIMDDVHVAFAHRDTFLNKTIRKTLPKISAEETPFGFAELIQHTGRLDKMYFLMPNYVYISHPFPLQKEQVYDPTDAKTVTLKLIHWYVPIDDTNHYFFKYRVLDPPVRTRPIPPEAPPVFDEVASILAGKKRLDDVRSHPDIIRIEDGIVIVGQGPIADRKNEHLGRSDIAVIMLRRIWMRELRYLAEGRPLTSYRRPTSEELTQLYDFRG